MSAFRLLCAALLAGFSIVVVGAAPSYACSCVSADAASYADRADVVVSGTVTDVVALSSRTANAYPVDVDRVFKGRAGDSIVVLSDVSGASCGLENIEPGRRYVVFASHQSMQGNDDEHLWANLCGGTAPATPALLAGVEQATGSAPAAEPQRGAYESELVLTMDEPADPQGGTLLAGWAGPLGAAAGASLLLLTGTLWARLRIG